MKPILLFSILLSATITLPAIGELTAADLDKIRLIVNEEVTKELTKELAPIKADIAQLDDRLRNVEIAIGSLTGRMDGIEKTSLTFHKCNVWAHRPYRGRHRHPRVAR